MTIGFNGLTLSGQRSGIGFYAANLLQALWSIDTVNTYVGWVSSDMADDNLFKRPNVRVLKTSASIHQPGRLLLWEHLVLPHALRCNRVDVFFSPAQTMPLLRLSPSAMVVTVHDLAYLHYPGTKSRQFRTYMHWMLRHTARSATLIIADSEHTRQDVMTTYNVPAERLTTITLAASKKFSRPVDTVTLDRVKKQYGLQDSVVLAVGDMEPRKNIPRLIEAVSRLKRTDCPAVQLVLVGKARRGMAVLQQTIHQLGLSDSVILTGYVPDDELAVLYRLARVFVYPSLYEGFGIPPLEAMMCGTPVVASNASSIPEVIGNAGILVDPNRVESISDGIHRVLTDPGLARDLIANGYQQAQRFSWETTARQTLNAFERCHRPDNNLKG